jgi:hypothetical protein
VVDKWGRGLAAVPVELAPATWRALSLPAWWAVQAEEAQAREARLTHEAAERGQQSELLREVLGNPFRPQAPVPAWLAWNGGTVAQLALAAYEERILPAGNLDPARLSVLADALEEAGGPQEVLAHLRDPGPHVRGCHAIDLVLGKACGTGWASP